jgi:hypothetical protein
MHNMLAGRLARRGLIVHSLKRISILFHFQYHVGAGSICQQSMMHAMRALGVNIDAGFVVLGPLLFVIQLMEILAMWALQGK